MKNLQSMVKKVSQYLKKFVRILFILYQYAKRIAIKISTLIILLIKKNFRSFSTYSFLKKILTSCLILSFCIYYNLSIVHAAEYDPTVSCQALLDELHELEIAEAIKTKERHQMMWIGVALTIGFVAFLIYNFVPLEIPPDPEIFDAVAAVMKNKPPANYR